MGREWTAESSLNGREVATRGSVMYFNMTDMTLVSNPITLQPSGRPPASYLGCNLAHASRTFYSHLKLSRNKKEEVTTKPTHMLCVGQPHLGCALSTQTQKKRGSEKSA